MFHLSIGENSSLLKIDQQRSTTDKQAQTKHSDTQFDDSTVERKRSNGKWHIAQTNVSE